MFVRECGGCTACCKTHDVPSINKPAFAWCESCAIGQGCTVYVSRPEECKTFRCQWLLGLGGASDRPDRVRIVVDYSRIKLLGNALVAQVWEVSGGALRRQPAKAMVRLLMAERFPILTISCDARQEFFFPTSFKVPQEAYDAYTKDCIPMKHYAAP